MEKGINDDMEKGKTLRSLQKVWKTGEVLCIAVPRRIREVMGIQRGDYVEVDWGEIIKKGEKEVKSKKINDRDTEYPYHKKEEEEEELPEID